MNHCQYLLHLGYIDLPFKRQSLGVENIINNSSIPVAIIFLVPIYYFLLLLYIIIFVSR